MPTKLWGGFFIGGQIGGSVSDVVTSEFIANTDIRTNRLSDFGSSFSGGLNAGYNWTVGNGWVVGVVVDVNGMKDQARRDFAGGNYIGATIDFTASAQVRGGYLVAPNVLLYGQGGLAVADQRLQIDFGGPETDERKVVTGFTVGGGAEWKLDIPPFGFGKSTSVFVDYRHTFWDKSKLGRPIASPPYDYTWCRDSNAVNLGFRFGL